MSQKFHNFLVKYQKSNTGFENLAYLQSIEMSVKYQNVVGHPKVNN